MLPPIKTRKYQIKKSGFGYFVFDKDNKRAEKLKCGSQETAMKMCLALNKEHYGV